MAETPNRRPIDAVTASVIQGALENIAVEMGWKLMRMSYSSIIRESEDFGAAIIDRQGRQLCESVHSTPLQSGPIPGYVRGMNQILEERGQTLHEGDVIIHNSAYHGASHGPDVAFIVPVFLGGALVGYAVTTAHHLDIGALSPGSCGIVDAMDAYAEGLQFKALKAYDRGAPNEGALAHDARQHPRAGHGGGRHGGAGRGQPDRRRALPRADRAPRAGHRGGGGRCAHGLFRAADAPGDRGAARRHLPGGGPRRRLPRRPRPASFQGRRGRHRQGQRAGGGTWTARRASATTGPSTCRSKARSIARSG